MSLFKVIKMLFPLLSSQTHQRLLKEKYPDFVLPSVAVNYVPEIADNAYRRLGSRHTRVVCATLGGDASGTIGGENSGVVGDVVAVPGSGPSALLSSRRSSSESVSSSVFASGTNVHMYRAKPISDTKTRLVSVAMDTTGPAPAPPPAEVKRQDSTGASTEAVNGAEPMDATADAVAPLAVVSEAVESVEHAAVGSAVEISSSGEVTEGAQVRDQYFATTSLREQSLRACRIRKLCNMEPALVAYDEE